MTDDDATYEADSAGDDERERARSERAAARRRLLEVEPGNVRDLDAAAGCECSCHPRPGQPDRHGDQTCHCQWTDQTLPIKRIVLRRTPAVKRQKPVVKALMRRAGLPHAKTRTTWP